MSQPQHPFSVKIAQTGAERRAAQALRYEVFVRELGAAGDMVDHEARLERDRFDPFCDHLLLSHVATGQVVGVYRVMRSDQAAQAGGFYSEGEYDLTVLKSGGRRLLELGRSCLHRDYRGGAGLWHMWSALAEYVRNHDIEILFGVASFHGTDAEALAQPLSMLHHNHLAPEDLRVRAHDDHFVAMDRIAPEDMDRRAAMLATPALIKAYLRLGGFVGQGAWVDHAFNTIDICLILDMARLNQRQARLYGWTDMP